MIHVATLLLSFCIDYERKDCTPPIVEGTYNFMEVCENHKWREDILNWPSVPRDTKKYPYFKSRCYTLK